jgi:hypothetical protein
MPLPETSPPVRVAVGIELPVLPIDELMPASEVALTAG